MRRTDIFVYERLRLTPLSVSADRIAHVALRCAVSLAKFEAAVGPADRSGSGPIAEVYPAASLRSRGLDHRGYKQKTATGALAGLVDRLLDEAQWLDCTNHEQDMRQSHDIFDAVIAAMTARAAALCQTISPAADDLAAAEGWIVIPDKPIRHHTNTLNAPTAIVDVHPNAAMYKYTGPADCPPGRDCHAVIDVKSSR
jgi:hypothetical protein